MIIGTTATTALLVTPAGVSAGGGLVTYSNVEGVSLDGGNGSLIPLASLNLSARLSVTPGKDLTVRLSSLAISGSGSLDMTDNDLILDYTGPAPLATVRGWLQNGRGGVLPSILTSTPSPAAYVTALALSDNALLRLGSWNGHVLTSTAQYTQLLIKYTYAGDTDMDGQVTPRDYLNVIANMGKTNSQWLLGDLNHDGQVTPDDLAEVSSNMGAGTSAPANPPLAAAASRSAEPSAKAKTPVKEKQKTKTRQNALTLKLKKLAKLARRHAP